MLEGIEPTVSTIPLGSTNKIVSGDQPSTVSRNHSQHTISFSSKYDWIPCGVIATDSNHSLSFLSVFRRNLFPASSITVQVICTRPWKNKGILVSLTGNFCGYPKTPSTPLINLSSYFTSSVSSCVVTWWILDFRERSTHRNACCIIHLTHPTHSLPRHNMSEVYKFVATGEVLLRHIFLHSV